jgi:hypothetical protein
MSTELFSSFYASSYLITTAKHQLSDSEASKISVMNVLYLSSYLACVIDPTLFEENVKGYFSASRKCLSFILT